MSKKQADFSRAEIEAARVIQKNFITSPPISLEDIAEGEGLNIAVTEFEESEISGFIDFEKKLILVNKYDSTSRQRFTIAHELGHWILHQKELQNNRDLVVLYRRSIDNETDPLEQEANFFAANLLVPISFLQKISDSSMTNKRLSNIFKVSEAVIAFRRGLLDK
jgi:Zn-dependent peptidase ImmA (M78 family)